MKKHYIKAVVDLLLQGKDTDVVLANLKSTLARKGHLRIHAQVLQGAVDALEQQRRNLSSTVTVAKSDDLQKLESAIRNSLNSLGGTLDGAIVTTDETLAGGYIASHNGKRIDASYKDKLITLYRSITT